jgi:hypothetical protein
MRNGHKILGEKFEGKRLLRRARRSSEGTVKTDLRE